MGGHLKACSAGRSGGRAPRPVVDSWLLMGSRPDTPGRVEQPTLAFFRVCSVSFQNPQPRPSDGSCAGAAPRTFWVVS